jgi:nucleoside diphosphate kinase
MTMLACADNPAGHGSDSVENAKKEIELWFK